MVGIVIVSHSHRIAEGVVELARGMGGADVKLETAGGLEAVESDDEAPRPIGTDAIRVMEAIERAWSDDGVLVLMDLGSAVLSAEMAIDLMDAERRTKILLSEAPLVEGAVAAAVTSKMGMPLDVVAAEARSGLAGKVAHLGIDATGPGSASASGERGADHEAVGTDAVVRLSVDLPHGLHARPAARFVQTTANYDVVMTVRNLTTGTGPADGSSLNGVATLGVQAGHEIEVRASGPDATAAIEAIEALAARRFDEPSSQTMTAIDDRSPATIDAGALQAGDVRDEQAAINVLTGSAASPGVAVGQVRRLLAPRLQPPDEHASGHEETRVDDELAALVAAVAETAATIADQRDRVATQTGEGEARIFDAHLLFLRDPALLEPARMAIRAGDGTAARAWSDAIERVAATWDALDDEYIRARAIDLRSVGAQVLARILGVAVPAPRLDAPGIVVADELTPTDTAGLDPDTALGIVAARGGPTSHAAVMARALGIPAVVGVGPRVLSLPEGTSLAIDGGRGEVRIEPSAEVAVALEAKHLARVERLDRLRRLASHPVTTLDGMAVEVSANVGRPQEVAAAVAAGADGIGLFRTEFLFMDRHALPDEREQETAYRAAAEALRGRPLLVRTLDAGADKPVAALGQAAEANPFLGVRGIRLALARPEVLLAQLRALLRVAADHPVRVMFPMIATTDELAEAREAVEQARRATGIDAPMEVGVMIEVPAAALTAAALATHADFFSIGTNDLTQYTLAADRGNERVAGLNDPLHPSVLRLIAASVEGAAAHDRWVGICGELAGDELATALLLGLGVRELSMAAPSIAAVKDAVRSTRLEAARDLAGRALACATTADVRRLLSL